MIELLRSVFGKRLPRKNVLIYGLQRSGTNYLEALIARNFPAVHKLNGTERNVITHKHFRLYQEKNIIPEPQFHNSLLVQNFTQFEANVPGVLPDLYIVASKDPYSWLSSYQRWSKKNNWPPHEHHYIQEYDLFYGMWMQFARETTKVMFIRYDDLLAEPEKIMNQLADRLGYPAINKIRVPKKVYASKRFSSAKKEAHLSGAPKKELSEEDKRAIQQFVRPELMQFMGYTKN